MAKNKKNESKNKKTTNEQYDIVKNIVKVHSEYLLRQIDKSVAVLKSRIEISNSMKELDEVIYYTGALEQTQVYLDMLLASILEVENWCSIKIVDDGVEKAPSKKRVKRIPVRKKKRGE
jgi:hypothetical protein